MRGITSWVIILDDTTAELVSADAGDFAYVVLRGAHLVEHQTINIVDKLDTDKLSIMSESDRQCIYRTQFPLGLRHG